MAKILLHTLVFSPDGVSTAYLVTDLVRELQYLGHTITVLTTTPHYNIDQSLLDRQPMKKLWGGLIYRSDCDGMTVWHIRMPLRKGQEIASRALDYIRFHFLSVLAGIFLVGSYEIVIAPSPPLTIGVVARVLGLLKRVPVIYNVQEIYPDFAINQGLMKNPVMIGLMRWIEKFVYGQSSKVVTISEWFSRRISQRGIAVGKLCVIPNFVDTKLHYPMPRRNSFAERYDLINDFVILYAGNIGLSQDWESMMYAAQKVAGLPIKFIITGDGVRREWLQQEIETRGLTNIQLLGYLPKDWVPEIYASSSLCTIPMKTDSTTDTFPSKIYSIMASGRAVLVSADLDSELSWVIEQSGCGRVVTPENPEAYADAVLKAYQERSLLDEEGMNGRRFVERDYSKEAGAHKYDLLIRELVRV